jgi:hypothetical protein
VILRQLRRAFAGRLWREVRPPERAPVVLYLGDVRIEAR